MSAFECKSTIDKDDQRVAFTEKEAVEVYKKRMLDKIHKFELVVEKKKEKFQEFLKTFGINE